MGPPRAPPPPSVTFGRGLVTDGTYRARTPRPGTASLGPSPLGAPGAADNGDGGAGQRSLGEPGPATLTAPVVSATAAHAAGGRWAGSASAVGRWN